MSFLTLRLPLPDVVRVAVRPPAPVHLRDRSLLLEGVVVVASLIVRTLVLSNRVDATVLASMRHLHLKLLDIDLAAGSVMELRIVLRIVFAGAALPFR